MGQSVEEYLAFLLDWWDALLRHERCPQCHGPYRRHQTRERAAWDDCDHAQRILVLRIRCPGCGITRTVLPDFLTPYRRYRTDVREAVVAEETSAPPCDARTARRWVRAFRARITEAIASLTAGVLGHLPLGRQETAFLAGVPPAYARLGLLRHLAARQTPDPPASSLLGWANQHLCRRHAWAL